MTQTESNQTNGNIPLNGRSIILAKSRPVPTKFNYPNIGIGIALGGMLAGTSVVLYQLHQNHQMKKQQLGL